MKRWSVIAFIIVVSSAIWWLSPSKTAPLAREPQQTGATASQIGNIQKGTEVDPHRNAADVKPIGDQGISEATAAPTRPDGSQQPIQDGSAEKRAKIESSYSNVLYAAGFTQNEVDIMMKTILSAYEESFKTNELSLIEVENKIAADLGLSPEKKEVLHKALMDGVAGTNHFPLSQLESCIKQKFKNATPCTKSLGEDYLREFADRAVGEEFSAWGEIRSLEKGYQSRAITECQESDTRAKALFELYLNDCNPI